MVTVEVASLKLPPSVVQWSRKLVGDFVMGEVAAVPLTLLLLVLLAVKSGWSGLETVHDCMPEVTHPSCDVAPDATELGLAMNTIEALETCTVQDAVPVSVPLVQVSP